MSSTDSISVDYYTDVLCVWAWIAQPRLQELQKQWQTRIVVHHRYVDVFGDSHTKITEKWGKEKGFERFSAHVLEASSNYKSSPVNSQVWKSVRPRSSMQAHLILKAAKLLGGNSAQEILAAHIRHVFFTQAQDISDIEILLQTAVQQGLDEHALRQLLRSGEAMAELCGDQRRAQEQGIKGSPTWVLNEGRQLLYGNVGYRILNANLEELLKHSGEESSWC